MVIKMSKVPIKIELSAKEDAIIYYEKTMGSKKQWAQI